MAQPKHPVDRIRIGLDARFALAERRGIGNYSLELFKALAAANRDFELVFYSDREDAEGILTGLPNSRVRVVGPGFYPLWEQVILPWALRRDGIRLFHAVGNTAPIFMPKGVRLVITICDVMYMKEEEILPVSTSWYQRAGRLYRRLVVPPAARRADHLITISEFSRTDIEETLPGLAPGKITVTLLGLPGSFPAVRQGGPTSPAPLGEIPYLLHLGGLDPRKNTRLVVRSFLALKRSQGLAEHLVILGLKSLDSLALNPQEALEAGNWIHLPGYVPEAAIPDYYQHAQAFLFPSLYEGFGIPLLEAMACGTPIITSNVSSLPEVAGEAALLIDPARPEHLEAAILDLLKSPPLQARLRQAGLKRLAEFGWDGAANITLEVFRNALTGGANPAGLGHSGNSGF